MMCKTVKEKLVFTKPIVIVCVCVFILIMGNYIAEGITDGLLLCTQILIPSLFPFMILANLTVKSGVADLTGKYCGKITELIFGVSGNCTAVILLGLIGGYPVGAKGIASLYKENKISIEDAKKLSYSLVCAGPGFLITYIGICNLESRSIGLCLLISHILSVFILGIANRIIFHNNKERFTETSNNNSEITFSDALVESVRDSTYSMLEMCGTVTLFASILSILEIIFSNNPDIIRYIAIALEVTTASNYLCSDHNILLLAFAVGFGGLSIHFQVFQALRNIGINRLMFILYRIIQGGLTAGLMFSALKFFDISVPTYSSIINPEFTISTSVIGSILMIFSGMCFLNNLKT